MAPFAKSFGQAFSQSYDAESKRRRQKEDEIAQEGRLEERMGRTRAYELGQELERESRSATRQLEAEQRGRVDRLVRDEELSKADAGRRLAIANETEALRIQTAERGDRELGWKAASEVGPEYNLDLNAQDWKQRLADFQAMKLNNTKRADLGLPSIEPTHESVLDLGNDEYRLFAGAPTTRKGVAFDIQPPTDAQVAEVSSAERKRDADKLVVADALVGGRALQQLKLNSQLTHSADMYKRVVESRDVPGFVIDAMNDPDPAKADAARVRAFKQIMIVPGSIVDGKVTNDYYVYKATPPPLRFPAGSANPNAGSAGVSDSSPAMGGGPFASSSFRPLSDLPLATDPLRVSRLDSPTPELGKPTPLRQAIGEAMFRDKMSSAQQAEAYNTLGDEAASFYEDFAGEASRKLSRQQSSLDKAIGRDQSDRELLLEPKRFRRMNPNIPGAIMPRTPMEEIEFAKKLADLDARSNVNLDSFYDLIRRQRNLRPPPPLIK